MPDAAPAKVAEPSRWITISAPSVGVIWLPMPTQACAAARNSVLRRTSAGIAGRPAPVGAPGFAGAALAIVALLSRRLRRPRPANQLRRARRRRGAQAAAALIRSGRAN